LAFKVTDSFKIPVGVIAVSVRVLPYGEGVRWAKGYAPQAVDTVFFFATYAIGFSVIAVGVVSALVYADFAADATFLVAFN
jgi:hypothetical protein